MDSHRFSYEPGWGTLEVQRFLDGQPGASKSTSYQAGRERLSLASAVATQALLYSINPKVVLTLLEMQAGLVRDPQPTPNDLGWAMGYRQQPSWGWGPQVNWAARELYRAARDDAGRITAVGLGSYALMHLLGQTVDADGQSWPTERATATFVQTYRDLFGQDPRQPLTDTPPPPPGPFLRAPYNGSVTASSAFDHEYPLLQGNGSMVAWRGRRDASSYDGHDGWDYVLSPGTPVLAAAAGRVLVAGWSDDGCAAPAGAVIVDHGNGYSTLYWHLSSLAVTAGTKVVAGDRLGNSGATGCSQGAHLHFGVHFLGRAADPNGWCPDGPLKADPWADHPAGTSSRWLWVDKTSPCQ